MTPRQALQALPRAWRVVLLIGAIAGVGVVVGRDWAGLPAQVAAGSAKDVEQDRRLDAHDREYRQLLCALTLPDAERARLSGNPPLLARLCP